MESLLQPEKKSNISFKLSQIKKVFDIKEILNIKPTNESISNYYTKMQPLINYFNQEMILFTWASPGRENFQKRI